MSGAVSAAIEFSAVIHRETTVIVLQQRQNCVLLFFHVSFAGVNLWLNCQPGVLSWDLGHLFLWAAVL